VEYQRYLHNLDARVFEFICQEVLRAIGCTGISVTKFSKDDGVDVLGKLPMGRALIAGTPLHRMVGDISFFIYLQAKRHRADVPSTGPEVQGVFGSWVWLQKAHADGTLSDELQRAMAIADYRSADPALIILATTSRFTPDALSKAKTLGILALDGEQIAQVLIEAGYGVAEDTHGSWIIDTSVLAALADETIEVAAEIVEPDGGADDHDEARGVVLLEVGAEIEEAESVADRSTETPEPDGTEPAN
jgi:restriction endonuclease Mrr